MTFEPESLDRCISEYENCRAIRGGKLRPVFDQTPQFGV
jgi:hypothetical protein